MRWLAAAALIAAALPGATAAQSEAMLACSSVAVTPAFRERLADAMLGGEEAQDRTLIEQLASVTAACAERNKLSDEQGDAYFSYSIARLPRDVLVARLSARGLKAQVVDEALDFGPGRSNPVITGDIPPAEIEKLVAALAASGVDTEAVADPTWKMVGAYAAATSLMWQALAQLK